MAWDSIPTRSTMVSMLTSSSPSSSHPLSFCSFFFILFASSPSPSLAAVVSLLAFHSIFAYAHPNDKSAMLTCCVELTYPPAVTTTATATATTDTSTAHSTLACHPNAYVLLNEEASVYSLCLSAENEGAGKEGAAAIAGADQRAAAMVYQALDPEAEGASAGVSKGFAYQNLANVEEDGLAVSAAAGL